MIANEMGKWPENPATRTLNRKSQQQKSDPSSFLNALESGDSNSDVAESRDQT